MTNRRQNDNFATVLADEGGVMKVLRTLCALSLMAVSLCAVSVEALAEGTVLSNASSQAQADAAVAKLFPSQFDTLGQAGARIDGKGLLNENRTWGGMYSPRFQMEAGTALRIGLARGNRRMARNGFRALQAATASIAPDGFVLSRLPPDRFPGFVPSLEDHASGAAFFLAEACSAVLVSRDSRRHMAKPSEWKIVEDALLRAIAWLEQQENVLIDADRNAPNRLLFDALAFQACHRLGDRDTGSAGRFVALALKKHRADGVFEEAGGSDTTYQAVATRLSLEILLAGYAGGDAHALWQAHLAGAQWLSARVRADGSVDSSANTRTCSGGEAFMGKAKRFSVKSAFQALAYSGAMTGNKGTLAAAQRISEWASANPETDPCL
jgi:hypothetical protein